MSPEFRVRVAHDDVLSDIAFTADGRRLLTRGVDKTTRLWDTRTGREVLRFAQTQLRHWFAFSTDGKRMVIARQHPTQGGEARFELYDTDTGAAIGKPIAINEFINTIALSPNGRYLATGEGKSRNEENGGVDSFVKMGFFGARLWDLQTGQVVVELPHEFPVKGVTFSPDGMLIATRTTLNVDPVRLWSVPTGKFVAGLTSKDAWTYASGMKDFRFSLDGRWFAAGSGGALSVWRTTDHARVGLFMHKKMIASFSFSRDGRLLACKADKECFLWDLAAGRAIVVLPDVESFQFTPDGKRLIVVHKDNTVRIWQLCADDLIADACSRLERNLSHEEWRTYVGEEPYRTTCRGLPVPE